jgi:hypothetical protein
MSLSVKSYEVMMLTRGADPRGSAVTVFWGGCSPRRLPMNRVITGLCTLLLLAAFSSSALAHHGWSGYETEIRKMSGTIEESSYSNPHGSIRLKTPDKTWVVVLAPPSRMSARGLTEAMLKTGKTVSVEGYVHKTNTTELRAERISVDGKTIELR